MKIRHNPLHALIQLNFFFLPLITLAFEFSSEKSFLFAFYRVRFNKKNIFTFFRSKQHACAQ